MSYGLRTWGSNGVLELDTGSFTYQVIHNGLYQLSVNQVLTIPIAGFSPSTTKAASAENSLNAMPYESVAEGVVTIRSRNPSEADAAIGSAIEFRLLVMRYKN
jgi:hypothetical protein